MFGMIKTLAGGANIWFMVGLFAIGAAVGGGAGWTTATWKAEAAHGETWKKIAGEKKDDLDLSEENRKKDRQNWMDAVAEAKRQDGITADEAAKILRRLGVINNGIGELKVQAANLMLGTCNFGDDFDFVRHSAWLAATGRAGSTSDPARKANRADAAAPPTERADSD